MNRFLPERWLIHRATSADVSIEIICVCIRTIDVTVGLPLLRGGDGSILLGVVEKRPSDRRVPEGCSSLPAFLFPIRPRLHKAGQSRNEGSWYDNCPHHPYWLKALGATIFPQLYLCRFISAVVASRTHGGPESSKERSVCVRAVDVLPVAEAKRFPRRFAFDVDPMRTGTTGPGINAVLVTAIPAAFDRAGRVARRPTPVTFNKLR